jgi:hypothetical protein
LGAGGSSWGRRERLDNVVGDRAVSGEGDADDQTLDGENGDDLVIECAVGISADLLAVDHGGCGCLRRACLRCGVEGLNLYHSLADLLRRASGVGMLVAEVSRS